MGQLSKKNEPSILKLYTINAQNEYENQGSAVVIESTGVCITNYHVLMGAKNAIVLTTGGQKYSIIKIIDYSKERDLIKFKIDIGKNKIRPVIINSSLPTKGSNVFSLGYPNGFTVEGESTLSTGIISGFRVNNNDKYIQTTAPFTHGSSGGGLFDQNGKLIGITTGTYSEEVRDRHANMNKAIPSSFIINLTRNLNLDLVVFYNSIKNQENFIQGMIAYENHDFNTSSQYFLKHIKEYPYDAVAWFRLGNSFNQLGRKTIDKQFLEAAVECMLNCIDLDSNYYHAYGQLALIYAITNKINLAKYCGLKAYKKKPNISFTNYVMGRIFNASKDYSSAINHFTYAINLASDYDKVNYTHQWYLERAIANAWLNNDYKAESDYLKCLELNSQNQDALFWFGNFLVIRKRRSESCHYFNLLKNINPNYSMEGHSVNDMIKYNKCY